MTRSSANYRIVQGQLTPSRKPALILGLNFNHNPVLKAIFKGAAATAVSGEEPFQPFYACRVAAGMDPALARLTVARKLATLVLPLGKQGEPFNAEPLKSPAA